MEYGAMLKKKAYLNRRLKRLNGQGIWVKIIEVVPPVVETQGTEGEPDHELSSDDDIAQSILEA